jgi:hypothetical protein
VGLRGRGRAKIAIVAAIFVLTASASLAVFLPDRTVVRPACVFDGFWYCEVASGKHAREPFSRRPVVPNAVKALPGGLTAGFRAVALGSLALTAGLAAVLARRVALRLGVRDRASHAAIIAVVAASALAQPHALRLAFSVPTLVDQAGLAAGLLWMVLFTSTRRELQWISVAAAFLAICTREVWALPILGVSLVTFATGGRRRLAVVTSASAVAAVGFTMLMPSLPGTYSELETVRTLLDTRFGSASGLAETVWRLVFAVGLLPAVLLFRPPGAWLRAEARRRTDLTAATIVVSAVGLLVTAPLLGTDTPRLAFPAGLLLIVFTAPWLVHHRTLWDAGIVLALGTALVWRPLHDLIGTADEYQAFYLSGTFATRGLAIAVLALTAAGALTAVAERRASVASARDAA